MNIDAATRIRNAVDGAEVFTGCWPEPDLSVVNGSRRTAPRPPVGVFGPFWSGWMAATAEGAGCPVDYVLGSLLAGASALIGNARWVSPWQKWSEPPVLWIALVGRPSSAKSPGQAAVIDHLRALESDLAADHPERLRRWQTDKEIAHTLHERWKSEVKEATKNGWSAPQLPAEAVEPVEPARPRLRTSDVTPEALANLHSVNPKGLLLTRDELAGWLDSFGRYSNGGDRALWIEAFGGRSFTVDRVKTGREPITIPHLSVCVLGGIQPDRLASTLMAGDDDGLASRFLLIWPEPIPPRRPSQVSDDVAAMAAFRRLLALRMGTDDQGNPRPITLPLAEDGLAVLDGWRQEHAESEAATSGLLTSHWGKLPGIVLRLSLVLEYLWWAAAPDRGEPESVGKAALIGAVALVEDYFKPMAERAYGDAALPEDERNAATLARWIRRERPALLNARDLRRRVRLPGLRSADKIRAAITHLEDADWLIAAPAREGGSCGRQREDYRVNPKLREVAL
ncbi:YfjI family protein [Rhodospirillaceae bacterium SYSU D60014]|uniref:YfjI family protein n=1 Tax=Virgifigura deserti TaxID=2268457 RepID=UPI000E670E97